MFFSHEGHHKCREQWPDNALEYERAFNLFLDAILLIFPLIMLSTAYFSITKTLWQGMALERSTKRYAKSTGNNNYQNACKYDAQFMYFIRVFFSSFTITATTSTFNRSLEWIHAAVLKLNFCTQSISKV